MGGGGGDWLEIRVVGYRFGFCPIELSKSSFGASRREVEPTTGLLAGQTLTSLAQLCAAASVVTDDAGN